SLEGRREDLSCLWAKPPILGAGRHPADHPPRHLPAAGTSARSPMATPSPLDRNALAHACPDCDSRTRAEQCAVCFVGMIRQVMTNCGSADVVEDLAVALAELIRRSTVDAARPLEARFGLTRSQSRVAQLLAEGHPN